MEEFEITFLEVDVPKIEAKLLEVGAAKVGTYNYRRSLWDYPDSRMDKNESWLRLRTNGKETTLAYKQKIKNIGPDEGMKEIEVTVDSYEKTYELLKSLGFVIKREEENKRTRYKKGDTVFDIDFWPFIPAYLEVESTSLAAARASAVELGLDPKDGLILSAQDGYRKYGYNLEEYSSITFEKMTKK